MSGSVMTLNGNAKSAAAQIGTGSPGIGSTSTLISDLMKSIFSDKPWAYVAIFIGITPRAAKHKIYGTARYTADEVAALLQTEHGRQVLSVLMGEARPRWYLRLLKQDAVTNARLFQRRSRQELAEAKCAVDQLDDDIERAATALAIQDADFHQPHIDGLRAARGAENRALDQTKRK